jgi:thiocyanate desulfurase
MSEPEKTPAAKDESSPDPQIEMMPEPLAANAQVERYLKRKAEVNEQDHREFQVYLEEKARQAAPTAPPPPLKKITLSRRNALKVVAGTAVAGEAVALGYSLTSGSASKSAGTGTGYGAQKQGIVREMTDSAADIGGRSLGRWVALLPTKMGGGTYALDLHSNRVLASIWYWNYGDYNPISHHLCAFPSADPYRSFEFVNSTQGGKNCWLYDIQPSIADPAPGFNIYRVRYDGAKMSLMENVSEKTGLGLGVHVTVNPGDAQSYFVTDGQKDIAACFERTTSRVIAALKFDWAGNSPNLADCWQKGGTLTISKIYPDQTTGIFDYKGTKGQKIEWEMVPMGELYVEENQIPGDSLHTLSGADGTIWHPEGRWAATVVRLCGGIAILDRDRNFDPVAFLQFNKDSPSQYPVTRIDEDHWQVVFDKIASPGHEIGFSPDGKFLCMMNNLRENNCSIFDSGDPDPTKWKKVAHVEDPLWGGKYPNPFHMVFSIDGSKLYLSVLHPSPGSSGVMVVDTKTWTIKKEIQGIGPDLQTPAITYDGKYVLVPFSGFQRLSSGIAVIDAETDELMGILPSNGGHHDCVIIPTKMEHMKHTRSCTL